MMQAKKLNIERVLLLIVLAELCVMIISGVGMYSLRGASFFKIGVDPAYWIFYLLNIPQFIVANSGIGAALDISIILLLLIMIWKTDQEWIARILFILLLCFYVTLTGYLAHRNYQIGFVLVLFPFMFRKENRFFAFEALRYFVLFFYFSSAIFKILNEGITNHSLFPSFLQTQFTTYFLENNTSWRTDLNLYLISHQNLSYILYLLVIVIEFIPVTGFFTKRFDYWIIALLLIFHFCNWALMDIAPIGHVAFICSILAVRRNQG